MSAVEDYKGITIREFDVPCTPFVWTDDVRDGHGVAESIEQARQQIDAHWSRIVQQAEPLP